MFVFQWDQEDWKQPMAVMAYALIGIAGSVYVLLNTGDMKAFLGGLADVGGALFLFALVTEGVILNMVMALGKIREAREKGREEGRREGLAEAHAERRWERLAQALADGLVVGRTEGLAEERAAMIRALRVVGISEADIRRVEVLRDGRGNGAERG